MNRDVSRRTFLGASAASITGMIVGCGSTNEDHDSGTAIFLDYDEASLDAAYDQRVWALEFKFEVQRARAS